MDFSTSLVVAILGFFFGAAAVLSQRERIVSNSELLRISSQLSMLDENSAFDIQTNKQCHTTSSATSDCAPERFIGSVSDSLLGKPTYRALIALLDNYEKKHGKREQVTSQESREEVTFLNAIFETPVGRKLYEFLNRKGLVDGHSLNDFKRQLHKIWFKLYSKWKGVLDSCGFEHVFVGQLKERKVTGFHNWVQLYITEKTGQLNYLGYTKAINPGLYSIHFEWAGNLKPMSGVYVGLSPELEFSLFTLCYITRSGATCRVKLPGRDGGVIRRIQTHEWIGYGNDRGSRYVASAFFKV
ncbi:uridylate-specific endoribonuclease A-like isoform X1 [Ciona intestinalis]